ncbi:uncharacterized protein LOC110458213 isoform X2 [Mizuhopecten yessoensis]|uniref:uncharacterized protein LOC110458213 isoform X2 n=1 Tax=Mizuhopecten yessoensis TaxID=6573 RepID=UPI000B45F035|nr:uncharacterized protein LOC110458213 isoform X2 [Mizuhopecten yessoensis]
MKTWVVFACFIWVSLAQDYIELRPYNVTAANLFYSSDIDGNGQFERDELNGVFEIYDVNHDNRVARHEYLHLISPPLYNFAVILFEDYDCFAPPDGFIDDRDFDEYYIRMDGNKDGMVDRNEFVDHWIHVLEKNEDIHRPSAAPVTP